jgi:2-amino-4-hydroxy-6-hydroxymethyldihydropteridine diphosphokinase
MQVRLALTALSRLPETRLVAVSRLYRNPPLGALPQPDYVNAVAGLLTQLSPSRLLAELQAVEQAMGREREPTERWASRRIDLDLLAHGQSRCDEPELTLPHPGIAARNFVLFPLLEIAPTLDLPGLGPADGLAARLAREGLVALG